MSDSISTEMHITFEWINYADVSPLLYAASVGGLSTAPLVPPRVPLRRDTAASINTINSYIWEHRLAEFTTSAPSIWFMQNSLSIRRRFSVVWELGRSQLFCFVRVFPLIKTFENLVDVGGQMLVSPLRAFNKEGREYSWDQPSAQRWQCKWHKQKHGENRFTKKMTRTLFYSIALENNSIQTIILKCAWEATQKRKHKKEALPWQHE